MVGIDLVEKGRSAASGGINELSDSASEAAFLDRLRVFIDQFQYFFWDGRPNYLVVRKYVAKDDSIQEAVFTVRSKNQIKPGDRVLSQVKVVGPGVLVGTGDQTYTEGGRPIEVVILEGEVEVDGEDGVKVAPVVEHLDHGHVRIWGKIGPDEFLKTGYDFTGLDFKEVSTVQELLAGFELRLPGKYLFYMAMLFLILEGLGIT